MGRVPPEVVVASAMFSDMGNALFRIEDRQQPLPQGFEITRRSKLPHRSGVLLPDPRQRSLTGNILQPQVGIVASRGLDVGRVQGRAHDFLDLHFRKQLAINLDSAVRPKKWRKRGGILEQRRRLTVKLQSHFALSYVVATRLNILSK